jgi:5-methylcytosine-specific restriction endonuclease McrA
MNDIVNKAICLKLNKIWQPIGIGIISNAIVDLVGGTVMAIDFEYEWNADGTPNLKKQPYMNPVEWESWLELPIYPWRETIHSKTLQVRVPTVVIAKNFDKMVFKNWKGKPSKDAIYNRDGGICQYTGQTVSKKDASVDHVIPKSRGGSDDWTNLALTSRKLNSEKGNALNSEIGLRLRKNPIKPRPVPVSQLIKEVRHFDWSWFINKQ